MPDDDPFDMLNAENSRPAERAGMVLREDVLRRLTETTPAAALVVIVAPAGYGKTTVLSQWAAADPALFAWVSLDDTDNDAVRLVQHIATSVHRGEPGDDQALLSLFVQGASAAGVLVPRLLTWLAGRPGDRVLVLDDLHRLHSPGSLGVIDALVTLLPPAWRLAVASRVRPDLHRGPLRRQRRYLELGPEDLSFNAQEIGEMLAKTGLHLPDATVASLLGRTEGWPAGIYLAALSIRNRGAQSGVARITGDDAQLADYFRDQVLAHEDAETVRFLLQTAVLERLSGPLCDAVLATTGSTARLEEIENANLFLVPQDRRGQWYRYHQLFAEMLLSELRHREPESEPVLHRRAAVWFAEQGLPQEAIDHALAGRDLVTAARLVTKYATPFTVAGRIATVRKWLEALGDEGPATYPPLAVMAAWVWVLEGEAVKAQESLRTAERASFANTPSDGSSSLESGICIIRGAMAPLGLSQMLRDGRRAVELEPPGSRWHPFASWVLGSAELLRGQHDRAVKEFQRAAYLGRDGQKPAASLAHAQLALLAAERLDWLEAADQASKAQRLIRAGRLQDFPSSMLCYAASARVAAHQPDRESAMINVNSAIRLSGGGRRPPALYWLTTQVDIVLGQVFLELNDVAAARLKVREARSALARLATQGTLRERLERLADEVARHGGPADEGTTETVITLTHAELRVLELLPMHLTLAQIASELNVSRNTVKSHVAALYRKLQATTRDDAVQRARRLGLLSF